MVRERAETLGRRDGYREGFQVVMARSFGRPAVTAEGGSALTAPGGRLVVSEPPGDAGDRWPTTGLASLGLRLVRNAAGGPVHRLAGPGAVPAHLVLLAKDQPSPAWVPRRSGVPAKRPLF